ncbi:MAG: alanine--glyoxylate aminotransferase family protein [Proteobacteria bacterium]|nr:alanine--glyoxylate aminotransferase family protein [Pseudomonadota bacterium]NDC23743.1 alanine--glyoxylate aminotransferase family protein [Pseudomonadota bacterium]NDD03851.1 alanine--glyoxylate aminotransferase family protein [Pseudomonadota bacterium]NDG26922.1 alanine--glyoxylate aminotransferase family protein [Pseudomonadota bacterium]
MKHPVFEKLRIFAPGPTPVPEAVLLEMGKPTLHHRTKEFIAILERVRKGLQFVFQTSQPTYVFAASGSGAMEATVVNCLAQQDEVLVIDAGKFGERWTKLATAYGLKPHVVKVEWGKAVDPSEVEKVLKANPNTKAVLFQASETSTGVFHPVKEIAAVVKKHSDALIVVDAITALGVCNLPMDEWGLDAVVSGSQKAFMLPPGLAFLALSPKAQESRKRANIPNFYFSLKAEDKAALNGETAWTPAVSLICGLDLVLKHMQVAGLSKIFDYHQRLANATRKGVEAMGLELFAKSDAGDSVTSVWVPPTIPDGKKIVSHLRDQFGITIAGGQDQYKGKIFRLAHLGWFDELDMLSVLGALEITLTKLGHKLELGKGVGRAAQSFLED